MALTNNELKYVLSYIHKALSKALPVFRWKWEQRATSSIVAKAMVAVQGLKISLRILLQSLPPLNEPLGLIPNLEDSQGIPRKNPGDLKCATTLMFKNPSQYGFRSSLILFVLTFNFCVSLGPSYPCTTIPTECWVSLLRFLVDSKLRCWAVMMYTFFFFFCW